MRLGLERGDDSARGVLHGITTSLLQEYEQGDPCAENDPSFTSHNSFLVTDCREAYVLEIGGKHWVAERATSRVRNISNNFVTIRTKFHLHPEGFYTTNMPRVMDFGTEMASSISPSVLAREDRNNPLIRDM